MHNINNLPYKLPKIILLTLANLFLPDFTTKNTFKFFFSVIYKITKIVKHLNNEILHSGQKNI